MNTSNFILTPDQRLRVFVSSTLRELAEERNAVKEAITQLHLAPVMFELGARPHPPVNLYRAYLEQSHIFIGIYWQSYGYVADGMEISGVEDEYRLAAEKPKLIYIKSPAPEREQGLERLLEAIKNDEVSYRYFSSCDELRQLVENDLALLLTERFELTISKSAAVPSSSDTIQNNLPNQITSFIGREAEITALKQLIGREHVRLVTLTGPGGIGKTRLGLQVATECQNEYSDGVFFVSLAEAHDHDMLVSKIAEQIGVREGGSQSLLKNVKAYLKNKRVLLLLDNFEQVLAAATVVTGLLEFAPMIKVMVTSRSLLNVRGEYEFQVPTLEVPNPDKVNKSEQLADCESVRMFIERARTTNPRFTLDQRNAAIIAEICQHLDGLPLALELAAARIKMYSPEKLLTLLGSRFSVLTGGGRDLPERQQTLRNTLDWSEQLLTSSEKVLFARLGVFMGGFTMEAATDVCHIESDTGLDISMGIESLVNNSLVQVDREDELRPRFRMLESIREFALEKLTERGELKELQRRHAQYFVTAMNLINPKFSTHEAELGLAWVAAENDNLRSALAYCLDDPSLIDLAPWLLIAMNWPWYRRGFLSEGRNWANRLLRSSSSHELPLARCYSLWSSGAMAMWQGDLNNALSLLEEAVNISKSLESSMAVAITTLFLATTWLNRGEDKIALQQFHEALEIFQQLELPWYAAITMVHMGNASLGMGNIKEARSYLDGALKISQEIRENWLISFILNNYGEVARTEGDYQKAFLYYEESESLLRAMGDKGDLARLVHNLGCIALHIGDLAVAQERFFASLAMFAKLGNQRGMAECLASIAGLWSTQGQLVPAIKMLSAAHALLYATGAAWWPADHNDVDRNLQSLQEAVDHDQFEAAWDAGKRMNLESALAFAHQMDELRSNS